MLKELFEQLDHPSSEYRGAPFWSWNGKLDPEELRKQIRVMHDMGMGGCLPQRPPQIPLLGIGTSTLDLTPWSHLIIPTRDRPLARPFHPLVASVSRRSHEQSEGEDGSLSRPSKSQVANR